MEGVTLWVVHKIRDAFPIFTPPVPPPPLFLCQALTSWWYISFEIQNLMNLDNRAPELFIISNHRAHDSNYTIRNYTTPPSRPYQGNVKTTPNN